MRLTAAERSFFAAPWRELDARLIPGTGAPLAIALSGGGDSTALLRLASAWTRERGRTLVALTVDHRLQPAAADWTAWCARLCLELGVRHRALSWAAPRPGPVAARRARHALLAEAARSEGANVLLLGHTADDLLEARLMRRTGTFVPDPAIFSPSPVWPEGRAIHLLRPLLGLRRAQLRAGLAAVGQAWIEDPANADPASARARARRALADASSATGAAGAARPARPAARAPFRCGPAGELTAPAAALLDAPRDQAVRWLAAALACASGLERPARRAAVERRLEALAQGPSAATLGGARLDFDGARVLAAREAGRSGPEAELPLPLGARRVLQGRFELEARVGGLTAATLGGRSSRLTQGQAQRVRALEPSVRPTLPVIVRPDGSLRLITLEPGEEVDVQGLVQGRLEGACGTVDHESAIVTWRSPRKSPKSAA